MNENNEKLWDDALNGIDPKFTDSAAESLMRAESGADGRARELAVPPKKRSCVPVIVGVCAAAAAALAVVVGVRHIGGDNPLVSSDTPSTAVNTDFSQYGADYSLFDKYFAGVWKNPAETENSPYLVLNDAAEFGSIYEDILFYENNGEYSMALMTEDGRDIYVKRDGRLYRYDYTSGELDKESYAQVYDYVEAAPAANSCGAVGFAKLCGRHDGLSQFMQGAQLSADGELWTRAGTENANVRVYSEEDGALTLSAQFTNEAGTARYFCLDLTGADGAWEIANVHEYDMASDTRLLYDPDNDPPYNESDWDVFESVFAGVWVSDSGSSMELSYSQTDLSWERIDGVFKVDGGWLMIGFSGGAGELVYISDKEPDTLYGMILWNGDETWGQYWYSYHRAEILPEYRGGDACLVYGIQGLPYQSSLAGYKVVKEYLAGLEGFSEAMEAAYVDFTDENGTEWSTDIPGGYLPIGYPGMHYYAITLTPQRVEIGRPFIIKGSFDAENYDYDHYNPDDLKITDFVLVFENTDGVWKHVDTRRDPRCDFLQREDEARDVVLEEGGAKLSYKVYSDNEDGVEISLPEVSAAGGYANVYAGREVVSGHYLLDAAPQLEVFALDGMNVAAVTYTQDGEKRAKFYVYNDSLFAEPGNGLHTAILSDSAITADPADNSLSYTEADGQATTVYVVYDEHDETFYLRDKNFNVRPVSETVGTSFGALSLNYEVCEENSDGSLLITDNCYVELNNDSGRYSDRVRSPVYQPVMSSDGLARLSAPFRFEAHELDGWGVAFVRVPYPQRADSEGEESVTMFYFDGGLVRLFELMYDIPADSEIEVSLDYNAFGLTCTNGEKVWLTATPDEEHDDHYWLKKVAVPEGL